MNLVNYRVMTDTDTILEDRWPSVRDYCSSKRNYIIIVVLSALALLLNFISVILSLIQGQVLDLKVALIIMYAFLIIVFCVAFQAYKITNFLGFILCVTKIAATILANYDSDKRFVLYIFGIVWDVLIFVINGLHSPEAFRITDPVSWLNVLHPGNYMMLFGLFFLCSDLVCITNLDNSKPDFNQDKMRPLDLFFQMVAILTLNLQNAIAFNLY